MQAKEDKPIIVLLADDDGDDRNLFHIALTEANSRAKLITAEDGDKLMKYLLRVDVDYPDIIFLDINMPCKNGNECLKEIRSDKRFGHVPVIMLTTSYFRSDIEESFSNGANMFISKLIFFNDEINILKRIFSLNWEKDLLKMDKEKFVLQANSLLIGSR